MADTENNYKLQKKPWKIWMSSTPDPTAVLVTANQLLNGTKLGHNILIYNGNIFTSDGTFSSSSFTDFYKYYIDIEPATFDSRSKVETHTIKGPDNKDVDILLHSKDAALYPQDLRAAFGVNSVWNKYFHPSSQSINNSYEFNTWKRQDFYTTICSKLISVDTIKATLSQKYKDKEQPNIVCYQNDDVFSSTMTFEDNKSAYTRIFINDSSAKIKQLIVGAVILNSDDDNLRNLLSNYSSDHQTFDINAWYDAIKNSSASASASSSFDVLDYIYFWVKAPFCADYIDPDDFNQSLNQDSDVVHRNLMVTNNYSDAIRNNFNRYDEASYYSDDSSIEKEFLEQYSRPYIPTNSPLKDFISNALLKIEGISNYDYDTHSDLNGAINGLLEAPRIVDSENRNVLGSVYSLPVRNTDNEIQRITPFNFYDPDSREEADYYRALGRLPTLIGRDGNITTDGRIMSPTIDELWYIIKKMISGEPAGNTDSTKTNIALPHNEIAEDTTLKEAVMAQYNQSFDGVSKAIDPIDFEYECDDDDGKINKVSVKEYVVQPESITHKIYTLLGDVSDRLNTFYNENFKPNDDLTTDEESGITITKYTGNSRALKRVGDYIIGTTKMETASKAGGEYGPRASAPLSLRELEAAILGNKYNIENNFVFASKTYAVTGKFGKVEKDDDENIVSGGSLYQMHRDYNATAEKPNTYFELGGKRDDKSGYDITAGDLNGKKEVNTEVPGDIPVYILDKDLKRTEETNTSQLPIMASNYGKSDLLYEEQGKYTGADVYMAADGTWRYIAEHIRLPILRSRY